MSSSECFICEKNLPDCNTREVKENGLKTLIEYSVKWKDDKHLQLKELKNVLYMKNVEKSTLKKVQLFFSQN